MLESVQGLNSWAKLRLGNGAVASQSVLDTTLGPAIFIQLNQYELTDGRLIREAIQAVCTYQDAHYYFTCLIDAATGLRLPDSLWDEVAIKQCVCDLFRKDCQPPAKALEVAFV